MTICTMREIGKRRLLIAMIALAVCGTLSAGSNQWTNVGPEGGRVLRLAADPQNPSTVYAATCGGVFKTVDAGASWAAMNSGLPVQDCIRVLVVDPQNAGTVYVASCPGIFKTTDGGASWSAITSGFMNGCPASLAIDPKNSGTLYAGDGEIFKTTDGGSSWTQVNAGILPTSVLAVDPQNPQTIYTGFVGLFRSIDGGVSWSPADSGLPQRLRIQALAFDPQTAGTLYIGGQDKIFKSMDGGVSWSDASFGLPPAPPPSAGYNQVLSLAVSPQTPAVIYGLIGQYLNAKPPEFFLVMSTDGGASWTTATDPALRANDLITMTPDPQAPGTLYLGTNNGVLKTSDAGGHWSFANSGLRAMAVGSLLIDSRNGTLVAANATQERWHGPALFESTDGGESWVPTGFGLPPYAGRPVADPQDPRTLYMTGQHSPYGSGLFKSEDGGGSWAEIWFNTSIGTSVGNLAIDPQNRNIMYAGYTTCNGSCYNRVAKSTDAGRTWVESQVPLQGRNCCSYIYSVTVDPRDPNIVYAATGDDNETGSGLWKSMDAGVSWESLTGTGDITGMAIDPRNQGTIYVVWNCCLAKSTDGGKTWVNSDSGLGHWPVGPIAIDPQTSETIYCVVYDYDNRRYEVFRSTDAAASWTSVSSGLAGSIHSLTFDPKDSRTVYAGTSSGLFAITFDSEKQ